MTIIERIESDMPVGEVAALFVACLNRLARDGREVYKVIEAKCLEQIDNNDFSEAASWLEELAKTRDD